MDLESFHGIAHVDVGAHKPKPTTLTPGQSEASVVLWKSPDGRERVGVWECTPGRFTADRSNETELCWIVSGKAVLRRLDGEARVLGAGDVLVLPKGWLGEWEILETTRKVFTIISG
jgi:uncharacterized cupin superfamily protein